MKNLPYESNTKSPQPKASPSVIQCLELYSPENESLTFSWHSNKSKGKKRNGYKSKEYVPVL